MLKKVKRDNKNKLRLRKMQKQQQQKKRQMNKKLLPLNLSHANKRI